MGAFDKTAPAFEEWDRASRGDPSALSIVEHYGYDIDDAKMLVADAGWQNAWKNQKWDQAHPDLPGQMPIGWDPAAESALQQERATTDPYGAPGPLESKRLRGLEEQNRLYGGGG